MEKQAIEPGSYRFERKFHLPELTREQVESILKVHPAFFREIYYARFVNNVYFDTPEMSHFQDAMNGVADRFKYRIRWYGDLWGRIKLPVLEIKIKKGMVGNKESYPLISFELAPSSETKELSTVFKESGIPVRLTERLLFMGPVFLNRFKRKYFQSRDGHFRITVDSDLQYFPIGFAGTSNHETLKDLGVILEMKYDVAQASRAERITQFFPFRVSKNSKYVTGLQHVPLAGIRTLPNLNLAEEQTALFP